MVLLGLRRDIHLKSQQRSRYLHQRQHTPAGQQPRIAPRAIQEHEQAEGYKHSVGKHRQCSSKLCRQVAHTHTGRPKTAHRHCHSAMRREPLTLGATLHTSNIARRQPHPAQHHHGVPTARDTGHIVCDGHTRTHVPRMAAKGIGHTDRTGNRAMEIQLRTASAATSIHTCHGARCHTLHHRTMQETKPHISTGNTI